jgi:chaperone modulatory protein CbpM
MRIELSEVLWLDRHHELSLTDLVELSGLTEAELRELVECGVITPIDPNSAERIFSAECLVTARTACRLRNDFELDSQGLVLALTLLDRIHDLEAQLRELHAHLPRRIR